MVRFRFLRFQILIMCKANTNDTAKTAAQWWCKTATSDTADEVDATES